MTQNSEFQPLKTHTYCFYLKLMLFFPNTLHYACIHYSHRIFIDHFSISEQLYSIFRIPSKIPDVEILLQVCTLVLKRLGVKRSDKPDPHYTCVRGMWSYKVYRLKWFQQEIYLSSPDWLSLKIKIFSWHCTPDFIEWLPGSLYYIHKIYIPGQLWNWCLKDI